MCEKNRAFTSQSLYLYFLFSSPFIVTDIIIPSVGRSVGHYYWSHVYTFHFWIDWCWLWYRWRWCWKDNDRAFISNFFLSEKKIPCFVYDDMIMMMTTMTRLWYFQIGFALYFYLILLLKMPKKCLFINFFFFFE